MHSKDHALPSFPSCCLIQLDQCQLGTFIHIVIHTHCYLYTCKCKQRPKMELCCHFTRREKKSVPFIINHSHGVLWLTNRLLERNKTWGVPNLGAAILIPVEMRVQRHCAETQRYALNFCWSPKYVADKYLKDERNCKFQIKKQSAKPRYICIISHTYLYQWWKWNKTMMWSSCGRNHWHNSHWPPGTGLGFEIKSCPDEQQWEKQNILCSNLASQIASICIDPTALC